MAIACARTRQGTWLGAIDEVETGPSHMKEALGTEHARKAIMIASTLLVSFIWCLWSSKEVQTQTAVVESFACLFFLENR